MNVSKHKKRLELLKKYFTETPEEQIKKDFNSTPDCKGMTISEFINNDLQPQPIKGRG